jgi:O-antigen/teichoic acid export membrane protein
MSSKTLVSNSVLILTAEVFERMMRLLLVIFSARLLGDVAYGKFTFALAFTSLFLILADGGIHQLIVRELARMPDKGKAYVANGLFLKFFLSTFTFGVIFLCARLTGKPPDVMTAVYIIGAAQIIGTFSDFFNSIFRAHQRMTYEVYSTLIFGSLVAGIGIAVLFAGENFIVLSYVYLLAHVARVIYCYFVVQTRFVKITLKVDLQNMKFLIREGFHFGLLFFFSLMYTYVDSTMLSLMVGDQAVGWYNAAYRLVFAMLFIPVAAMKAVFPALSIYYKESPDAFKALFQRSFKVMFLIGFSLATVIFVLSDKIILTIFGAEYAPASGALKILVWSTAIIFIGTVQTHTTRASDRQRFTAKVVTSSAILNLLANFWLIPRYSLYGAAIATLAAELFTFVFHSGYLARNLVSPPFFKLLPKIALVNIATAAYIYMINEFSLLIVIPTALIVNLLMVLATRYFSKDELHFIRDLVKARQKMAIT